jgi:uracil-DNA glycosylase family protein
VTGLGVMNHIVACAFWHFTRRTTGMSMRELREAVAKCHGCDLYLHAQQAVFGEGPVHASVVFIGEQPGDEEDKTGRPFVGPAGRLLDGALRDAGLERSSIYITNAVKHFKFEERGKRRLHKKPNSVEIRACRPWLEAEMELIRPRVLLCLGATAAQTVFGATYRVTKERGQFIAHPWAPYATSTIHPSAILRMPDAGEREAEYARFVADLKLVQTRLLT